MHELRSAKAGSLGRSESSPRLGQAAPGAPTPPLSEGGLVPFPPWQVVAVDPDLGENGTLVYSIQPPNKFYSLNSTTGKIRTTHVMLDRENPDPQEAEFMRKIIVSVTDCTCPHAPQAPDLGLWPQHSGLGMSFNGSSFGLSPGVLGPTQKAVEHPCPYCDPLRAP